MDLERNRDMMKNRHNIVSGCKSFYLLAFPFLILTMFAVSSFAVPLESGPKVFSSSDEVLQNLVIAVQAKDHAALKALFGPVARELEPVDPVDQSVEFEHFARRVAEGVELVKDGDEKAHLVIGAKKWHFPVPIVKKNGNWHFDTEAGREEILTRRIGHNELHAIKTSRAYVEAQREYYAMAEPDGEQVPKYAQRMISAPGHRDGLYWQTKPGEKESPLGPLVAKAKEEGYMQIRKEGGNGTRPFHGYYFKILKRQGKHAPGGKYNYIINSNMVAGFALVAYPANWGSSGVMTFIVNQRGRVYQKNLGPKTAEIARKIRSFNPDLSWKLATEQ